MAKRAIKDSSFDGGAVVDRPQGGTVVRINNQQFATDLYWDSVVKRSDAASEARAAAANLGAENNLFCVRQKLGQFGVGRKNAGHAKNMVSLAGALADAKNGNWIGVFAVDSGYYLLVVRDGDILAETDSFYSDEGEARRRFFQFYGESEWQEVFAPEEFEVEDASGSSISDILGRAKAPRLQETDLVGGWLKWGLVGLVVAGLIGGGAFYFKQQGELEAQAALDEIAKNFQQTIAPEQEIVIPPMPWEGKPVATEYLEACVVGLKRAIFSVPGWTTIGLACDGGNVLMALERDGDLGEGGGTINWVRYALDHNGLKDASASPASESRVEVSWPLAQVKAQPVEIETYRVSEARKYLQSWFEESFTSIAFQSGNQDKFVANLSFKFESDFEPTSFNPILTKVPGLTIQRVIFDLTNYKYVVEGSVHEKLELPPEIANAKIR